MTFPEHRPSASTSAAFRAADVYNLAASGFDLPALRFWRVLGERLVEVAALRPGERVLDIGCGTGAVALPAARSVSATPDAADGGFVVGVDIAERMIEAARARGRELGITAVRFERTDFLAYRPDTRFDTVLCGFSLFFFDDICATLARMAEMTTRPGRWAFSFWGDRNLLGPAATFKRDIERWRPGAMLTPFPWQRFSSQTKVRELFSNCGYQPAIVSESLDYWLTSAEQWWDVVSNSGYRRYVEELPEAEREAFRSEHLANVEREHHTPRGIALYLPVIFATVRLS